MASIDEELLQDQQETQREIAFIREQLPSDLKELYTDNQLVWMLDTIATYFYESGILESNDDEVDVDIDEVSDYLCKQAVAEGHIQYRSQTFDQALLELYQNEQISLEVAMNAATNRDDFDLKIRGISGTSDRGWM